MAGGLFPPDPAGDTTPAYIRSPPRSGACFHLQDEQDLQDRKVGRPRRGRRAVVVGHPCTGGGPFHLECGGMTPLLPRCSPGRLPARRGGTRGLYSSCILTGFTGLRKVGRPRRGRRAVVVGHPYTGGGLFHLECGGTTTLSVRGDMSPPPKRGHVRALQTDLCPRSTLATNRGSSPHLRKSASICGPKRHFQSIFRPFFALKRPKTAQNPFSAAPPCLRASAREIGSLFVQFAKLLVKTPVFPSM